MFIETRQGGICANTEDRRQHPAVSGFEVRKNSEFTRLDLYTLSGTLFSGSQFRVFMLFFGRSSLPERTLRLVATCDQIHAD